GVQRGPLGLSSPDPRADAREIFEGDRPLRALSLGHDPFRDVVVDPGGEPALFPSSFVEATARRAGVFAGELGPQATVALSEGVDVRTGVAVPIAINSDVHDAEVYPDLVFDVALRRIEVVEGGIEEPGAVAVDEIALALSVLQQRLDLMAADL